MDDAHGIERPPRGSFQGPCLSIRETAEALLVPRRLVLIVVVLVPVTYVQERELESSPWALPFLMAVVAALILLATLGYRALLAGDRPARTRGLRLLAFALLGVLAPVAVAGLPRLVGLTPFVSRTPTTIVSIGLFWVAGYGLGRDIELEERARRLAEQAENAQVLALRAQLDPHFLFNTLNAIAEWCRADPVVAERALLDLSSLLRMVFEGVLAPKWRLERELEAVRRLFELHRIRDPSRFDVAWSGPEHTDALVPPMLLLPLAENAMTHGHRGPVRLEVHVSPQQVQVILQNPGSFSGRRPGGEGIKSVEQRLALAYGSRGQLLIESSGQATRTTVRFPFETAPEN